MAKNGDAQLGNEGEGSLLRTLVEAFPGAAVHIAGDQVWCNAQAESVIGYPASEVATLDAWFEIVFAGHAQEVLRIYQARRGAGFAQPDVLRVARRDGSTRLVEFSGFRDDGQEVWFLRDVTEARSADQALRDREQQLRVTVDLARLGMWEWDLTTGHLVGDAVARALYGLDNDQADQTLEAFMSRVTPEHRASFEDAMGTAIEAAGTFDIEFEVSHSDGSRHWLHELGRVLVDDEGEPERVIGAARDITARKRLEDELVHAAQMESIGLLASGIAHDFNNLLAVIQGHVEFVSREPTLPTGVGTRLESVEAAVARGAAMVADLMQLGRPVTRVTVVDINERLEAGADTLRQIAGVDVAVELRLEATAPLVEFDPTRLGAVVLNLATNARDAMPDGGLLRITTRNGLKPHDGDGEVGVQVIVEDTGVGMDSESCQRLFQPFYTTKAPGVGSGLGLATSYDTIIDAGGSIEVASQPGQGTTFTIWLPCTERLMVPDQPAKSPLQEPVSAGRILVVEDDPEVLEITTDILRTAGHRVLEALGPHEALELLAAGEEPDLLLTDVVMPDLTGPELAARFKERLPDLEVLFMSAYSSKGQHGLSTDDDRLIRKPFSHQRLLDQVRRLLAHHR